MRIRTIQPSDHGALIRLWQRTEGICLRPEDALEPFCGYLRRNPELSVLLENPQGAVVGSLLVGHDGRRGYLQHLVVDGPWRGQGWARKLLGEARQRLALLGIHKCHVFVLQDAPHALAFWNAQADWGRRADIQLFSTTGERG